MDTNVIENRKFLNRVFRSDTSLFVFYQKVSNDTSFGDENYERKYNYLIIKKKPILDYSTKFSDELVLKLWKENKTYDLSISIKYFNKNTGSNLLKVPVNDVDKTLLDFLDLKGFDLENYYKFITETDFIQQLYNIIFLNDENYYWQKRHFYGLILDQKEFVRKYSDYGSDHTQTYIYANSQFLGFKKNRIFSHHRNPGDYPLMLLPAIQELGKEIFNYFYDEKELILTNFDKMALSTFSKIFWDNRRHNMQDKKYIIPEELKEKTFILSDQITSFIYEKEEL